MHMFVHKQARLLSATDGLGDRSDALPPLSIYRIDLRGFACYRIWASHVADAALLEQDLLGGVCGDGSVLAVPMNSLSRTSR